MKAEFYEEKGLQNETRGNKANVHLNQKISP